MKITGISGSPTTGGNNERLLKLALGITEEKGFEMVCETLARFE